MVDGYRIYAGWMLAAVTDLVFASDQAQFLGGFVEYNSIPWDLGFRKAKEICFESRFMTAAERQAAGFVSLVSPQKTSSVRPVPSPAASPRTTRSPSG